MAEDKKTIRKRMKDIRRSVNPADKMEWDEKIFKNLVSTELYKSSEMILCYISTDIEVDTRMFINYALQDGKKIAVPKCNDDNTMCFFEISSFDSLVRSSFGIDEPSENVHRKITDDEIKNSLCIVPALSFDRYGMRVGYGGGYYDRFLQKYDTDTIGICYDICISEKIDNQAHDVKIKNIITEKAITEVTDEQ